MARFWAVLVASLTVCPSVRAMPSELLQKEFIAEQLEEMQVAQKDFDPTSVPSIGAGKAVSPDPVQFPVRGIDISHYQGAIDWKKVANEDLSFVFMKATQGENLDDDMFDANWAGAAKAGLARGAYHFYDICGKGAPQANWFIRNVPADPGALPPAVDIETTKACSKKLPAKKAFHKELAIFVTKVKKVYGQDPIFYVNEKIYDTYFAGEEIDNPFWICDIYEKPELTDSRRWHFWQYSFKGRVNGISGDVDLDVFGGTPEELASLIIDPGADGTVVAMAPGAEPASSRDD